jgi:hypothetical protein
MGTKTEGGPLTVAIVRPTISVASLVWWPGCQTASSKKQQSKVKRVTCLGITGGIRTTPADDIEALDGLPPLDVVIQMESSAAHRIWSLGCRSYVNPIKDIDAY